VALGGSARTAGADVTRFWIATYLALMVCYLSVIVGVLVEEIL